jgi:hypothetical protein
VELHFSSNELHIPSYGINGTDLDIKLSDKARSPQYTVPIFADATFPSESIIQNNLSRSSNPTVMTFPSFVKTEIIGEQSSLTLNKLEPLSAADQFINGFNKLGNIIPVFVSIGTFFLGLLLDKQTLWRSIKRLSNKMRRSEPT